MTNTKNLVHLAIIMDGNGRWAKEKGKLRLFGHEKGADAIEKTVIYCKKKNIKHLSLFAFSLENWQRPKKEVDGLMKLFEKFLKTQKKMITNNNIRFFVRGDKSFLSQNLLELIQKLENESVDNLTETKTEMSLNLFVSYGSRQEILNATKNMINDIQNKKLDINKDNIDEKIDEKLFNSYLYTNDLPYPDLLIRTSGESRISNFMLWQLAYSEIYISKCLWPDFDEKELDKALDSFSKRERRYGKITVQKDNF